MKRKLANILRIVISLSLLTFLVYRNRGNFANIVEASKDLNVYYLIIAFIFYFTAISFIVFRWGILLKAHDFFISNRFLWQSALIGFFYNNLLPTSAGGDFYRVYDIKQNRGVPVNEGIASVVMERIIGTLSSIILLIIAYFIGLFEMERIIGTLSSIILLIIAYFIGLFDYLTKNAALGLIVSGLVIILFFTALFFPRLFKLNLLLNKFRIFSKIRPKLKEFHEILISYRHKVKYLVMSFLFTMIIQAFFFISYNFISMALGLELKFYIFLFIIPFVSPEE